MLRVDSEEEGGREAEGVERNGGEVERLATEAALGAVFCARGNGLVFLLRGPRREEDTCGKTSQETLAVRYVFQCFKVSSHGVRSRERCALSCVFRITFVFGHVSRAPNKHHTVCIIAPLTRGAGRGGTLLYPCAVDVTYIGRLRRKRKFAIVGMTENRFGDKRWAREDPPLCLAPGKTRHFRTGLFGGAKCVRSNQG